MTILGHATSGLTTASLLQVLYHIKGYQLTSYALCCSKAFDWRSHKTALSTSKTVIIRGEPGLSLYATMELLLTIHWPVSVKQ